MTETNSSIREAIENAPSPSEIAEAMLLHIQGEGRKKFSPSLFYNPTEETYDVFGYVCWMLDLDVECNITDDGFITNTGYCIAPDGSRELVTRVCKTVLGYDPRQASVPLESPYADDLTHLWTSQNKQLDEDGEIAEENLVEEFEMELFHREIPFDLYHEIEAISQGNRKPFPYEPFEPMVRPKTFAGKTYALPDQQ